MELLASHDFQTALENYLDLEDLRRRLASWEGGFDSFEDMIRLRRQYYAPLLPDVDRQFRELDSRMRLRLEQHKLLAERLESMLVAPRPDFLATTEERLAGARITSMEAALGEASGVEAAALRERIRRLKGALLWILRTEYHERLAAFHGHLEELDAAMQVLTAQYDAFVRVRQAATHSYEGYGVAIMRLRTRVREATGKVNLLMARQGHMLELVAIDALMARRQRLEGYEDQARYALADSYDRATKAEPRGEAVTARASGERD
jgi:hypothetical protein